MKIVSTPIPLSDLQTMAIQLFGNLVKAVVDVDKKNMAVDAELHADEEAMLLAAGSKQEHLWGINLYPSAPIIEWIEFDSMINVRPSQGNISRSVDNITIQKQIIDIVNSLVTR